MFLKSLEIVAKKLIEKYNPKVICITGSVGKTSTKEAIFSAINGSCKTRKTSRNYNNDYGVPISIIGGFESEESFFDILLILLHGIRQLIYCKNFPDVIVLEVGAGKKGEIMRIAQCLKPDIVVITNLPDTPSHLGVFGSKKELILEKKYIVDAMDETGVLVIDKGKKNMVDFYKDFRGRVVEYSEQKFKEESQYNVNYVKKNDCLKPVGFTIKMPDNLNSRNELSFGGFVGQQNIQAIYIALIVGELVGCDVSDLEKNVLGYKPDCGRLRIFSSDNDVTIFDDSFNASPSNVQNALDVLANISLCEG